MGLCSSATPMLTRRFMPPLNLSTRSFCRSTRVMSSSTSSTRRLSSSPDSPYMRPQNTRFSRALMSGYRAMSCGTTPMVSLTAWESVTTECPAMVASPPVGLSRQLSMEMVVLLPAPLGPRRLKISPSAMSKLTPSTASTPFGGSYCLRSSLTSTMLTGRSSRSRTAEPRYTPRRARVTRAGGSSAKRQKPRVCLGDPSVGG